MSLTRKPFPSVPEPFPERMENRSRSPSEGTVRSGLSQHDQAGTVLPARSLLAMSDGQRAEVYRAVGFFRYARQWAVEQRQLAGTPPAPTTGTPDASRRGQP